jgi:SAM-dependent methyltransferase
MSEYRYEGQELDVFSQASHWKQYFQSILLPYIGHQVAEVGAGIGATTAILCDGREEVWICIEPDARLRQRIEEKIHSGQLPACCKPCGSFVADLDPSQQFDTVLYIDVLEHIQNDSAELAEAGKRLVPGGALIVLSPAYPFLFSEFDRSIGHCRRYDRGSLFALTPDDCRVEQVYFLDSLGIATSLANRFFLHQPKPSLRQILFWDRFLLPISRFLDRLTGFRVGRSIVMIWRKGASDETEI